MEMYLSKVAARKGEKNIKNFKRKMGPQSILSDFLCTV